jgi:hypothetical protein
MGLFIRVAVARQLQRAVWTDRQILFQQVANLQRAFFPKLFMNSNWREQIACSILRQKSIKCCGNRRQEIRPKETWKPAPLPCPSSQTQRPSPQTQQRYRSQSPARKQGNDPTASTSRKRGERDEQENWCDGNRCESTIRLSLLISENHSESTGLQKND